VLIIGQNCFTKVIIRNAYNITNHYYQMSTTKFVSMFRHVTLFIRMWFEVRFVFVDLLKVFSP